MELLPGKILFLQSGRDRGRSEWMEDRGKERNTQWLSGENPIFSVGFLGKHRRMDVWLTVWLAGLVMVGWMLGWMDGWVDGIASSKILFPAAGRFSTWTHQITIIIYHKEINKF